MEKFHLLVYQLVEFPANTALEDVTTSGIFANQRNTASQFLS